MNIYIVRHGETEENACSTYYGNIDVKLNEVGLNQSKIISERLKSVIFQNIYVSTKKRAIQTAEIITGKASREFIMNKSLDERNFGVFEGKNYEEIKKLHVEECKAWEKDWVGYVPTGGESHLELCNRVFSFVDELIKEDKENILLVTHAGVIRAIYCYVMEKNINLYWKFGCKNGDMSIIKYEYGNMYIDSIIHFNC